MTEVTSVLHRKKSIEIVVNEALSRGVSFPCRWIDTSISLGKRVCGDVLAIEDIPPFDRSTRDGYAVRAEDTFGCSSSLPAYLNVIGEVRVDEMPDVRVGSGQAVKIVTGAPIPDGANAVVMVEYTDSVGGDLIEVVKPVARGENILFRGEDIQKGSVIVPSGKKLTPFDIGGLMSNGITKLSVFSPVIGIISTGDEIVEPHVSPPPGKIRDINSYTLFSMVEDFGFVARNYGIVADNREVLTEKAVDAIKDVDVLLFSGGSSAGSFDFVELVVDSLPDSRIVVRGIAISPGKPTLAAFSGNKLVFGMPGHPVSSLVIFETFLKEIFFFVMTGRPMERIRLKARLKGHISSVGGREEFVRGYYKDNEVIPIYGKSGMISTLYKANALIRVPLEVEGYAEGDEVEVWPI